MIANENRSELLQSLKEGSFSAFEKLYNLYSGKLYNFMMRLSSGNQYMAEEVVQQTFIRLWEVREKVDPTENFVSYLCTIARNLSMNMYQHQTVEYIYTEYLLKSNPDCTRPAAIPPECPPVRTYTANLRKTHLYEVVQWLPLP